VRVSLKSVSGVDSVDVSLEKGLASVKMKPGNTATLKQLNEAITKNGFTMKQSTATVAGKVVVTNGKTMLQVSGSNEMLELVPDSSGTPVATALNGKSVLVEATIPEAGKGKSPDSIRYRSVKEENSK
jgi:flagellar hook assembly protein FlgD